MVITAVLWEYEFITYHIRSSLSFITDDPYWKILSPPYIEAPIGVNLTLLGQYAYGSKGYGNTGYGLLLSLSVTPNTKKLPAYTVFKNITSDSNKYSYNHSFTVSTSDDADFNFQGII